MRGKRRQEMWHRWINSWGNSQTWGTHRAGLRDGVVRMEQQSTTSIQSAAFISCAASINAPLKTHSLASLPWYALTRSFAAGGWSPVPVAVKKFFMMDKPKMYGLRTAAQLAEVVKSELLPEINTLLGLSHPNLVALRCVGLRAIHGALFPACVR